MTNAGSPIWRPFTQHGLGEPVPRVVRTNGEFLHTDEGRAVIDAISSWWVITHGHCTPAIQAAIRAATENFDQIIFAGWTHEPAETLARSLVEMTPASLKHVFFSDSGSTAVEVALKMALGFWLNRGEPRTRLLVMEHSYHGDTIGAMSVGARGVFTRAYAPLLFDVGSIPFPVAGAEQRTLDALEAHCAGESKPAALIVEPLILGAGGMLMYPPQVLAQMRAICAAHRVLFIADEVMTGWGRTGTLLACDQANVAPDIMCLSKGITGGALPLAATLASAEIFDAHLSDDRARMFFHSSSYTANPIACAAANANVALWGRRETMAGVTKLVAAQTRAAERMRKLETLHDVRQQGTVVAMEVGAAGAGYLSNLGPRLLAAFRDRDVLLRPLGNTIYVMPPYCISESSLTRVYDVIEEVVSGLAAHNSN